MWIILLTCIFFVGNMPRQYKSDPRGRRYKKYDEEVLNAAIHGQTIFLLEVEKHMIKYINIYADWGILLILWILDILSKIT